MWDVMLKLRELMNGVKEVTMNHVRGMSVEGLRKLLEAVFSDIEIIIELFITKKPTARVMKKGRDTCAIVLEEGGIPDILSKVRPVLKEGGKGVIRGMKRTQEGKLLITFNKDDEAVVNVREKNEALSSGIKTRCAVGKKCPQSI